MIHELNTASNIGIVFGFDENNRAIYKFKLKDCMVCGDTTFYPNALLYSRCDNKIYNPINENIMSLGKSTSQQTTKCKIDAVTGEYETPVFFFIYNTDNYYHFIYDTLPYLITYQRLKKTVPDLKLLMNYPTPGSSTFYKFVTETLDILGIHAEDIIIAERGVSYKHVYLTNSYTHDLNPNIPPRKEIYSLFQQMVDTVKREQIEPCGSSSKLYISRRSWMHGDMSNIGTNYTTRRQLINEDGLVNVLSDSGYKEVFTENMSMRGKILTFNNAKKIVGAIGGGLVNAVFANKDTELIVLVSPTFFDKNARFKHSFHNNPTTYYHNTKHVETGKWKKHMRAKVHSKGVMGEVADVTDNQLHIAYAPYNVAGWNHALKLETGIFDKTDCTPLDGGLNSAWSLDIEELKGFI